MEGMLLAAYPHGAGLQGLQEGWLTGLEPATAWTNMQGYAAIVGEFRQKCGFLPERRGVGLRR
jgi:hypothetical protein